MSRQSLRIEHVEVFPSWIGECNYEDNTISLFRVGAIGSDGGLTAASPATVPTGTNPEFVVFYTAAAPTQ